MRSHSRFLALSASTSVLAFAWCSPTLAQQSQSIAQASDESNQIIVTARRKDESLMEVPVVVSTLSGEAISRYHSNDLTAIGEMTPTVIVGAYRANGGGSIAIRGISSPANQTGFEQAVSVAIDGIQTSNGRIAQLGFFDVEQVEVLKGPQALFFGKNSPAGVISVRTKGPTDQFEGGARASYEFVADEAIIDAYVGGPLSDVFGARVAVRYRYMDGWLRNTAQPITSPFYSAASGAPAAAALLPGTDDSRPGDKEFMGRVTLHFEPSSVFNATLKVFGLNAKDSGSGPALQNIGPCTGPNPRVSGTADPFADCKADKYTTSGDLPSVVGETFRGMDVDGTGEGELNAIISSLAMNLDLGAINVASLTGYNRHTYNWFSGLDQTTYSQLSMVEKVKTREFSHEIRLSSQLDGPLNFVIGGYFQDTYLVGYSDAMLSLGHYNAAANRYTAFETLPVQNGTTYSAFGQLIFDVTPELELAGGARWTHEKKNFDKENIWGNPSAIGGIFDTAATDYGSDELGHLKGKFSDKNVSPEVTLTWKPDSNHTVFAAYRTGFKSGGFGLTNPLSKSTQIGDVDFGSEKARGFEVGTRAILLDRRLNLSAAAFAYDFKDLQVNIYDPARIAYTINNAGKVRQRGFELEGNFRVSPVLTLHGALAYVHNRFKDFTGQCYAYTFPTGSTRATAVPPPNCSFVNDTALTLQQVFDGRAPARSPEWSGNAGFIVTLPVGSNEIRLNGDAYFSDSYYAADTLVDASKQDSFWRLNAGITYAHPDNRWSVGITGRNLTNEHYLFYAADRTGGTGVPGAIGEQRAVVSRGREVAVSASFNF